MGRYYWSKKEEADNLHKVEIWWLKKYGYLEKHCWKSGGIKWTNNWSGKESSIGFNVSLFEEEQYIEFHYTRTKDDGEKENLDYKVPLTTTPCYFGGVRYWFICPWYANGIYCGRRVGVLYLGGKYFACRHCYNLTYNSRNRSGIFKVAGQTISIPELERLESEVKRKYYAGKMTRRYKRYLEKQRKAFFQLQVMVEGLGGKRNR